MFTPHLAQNWSGGWVNPHFGQLIIFHKFPELTITYMTPHPKKRINNLCIVLFDVVESGKKWRIVVDLSHRE